VWPLVTGKTRSIRRKRPQVHNERSCQISRPTKPSMATRMHSMSRRSVAKHRLIRTRLRVQPRVHAGRGDNPIDHVAPAGPEMEVRIRPSFGENATLGGDWLGSICPITRDKGLAFEGPATFAT